MFHRIVVATDFSECAQEAWAVARRIAAAPGSELVLTHVLTEVPLYGEGLFNIETARKAREGARKWAESTLETWVGKARAEGLTRGRRSAPVSLTRRSWRWPRTSGPTSS